MRVIFNLPVAIYSGKVGLINRFFVRRATQDQRKKFMKEVI